MDYAALLKKKNIVGPVAFVDLEQFDKNAKAMARFVEGTALTIRIATKSLRVPELIRRALKSHPRYQGLMCFSVQEAVFLAKEGFNDLLIAYPSVSPRDLESLKYLHQNKIKVSMVIDDPRHLQALDQIMVGSLEKFPVLIELNLSVKIGPLVIGVRRSPIKEAAQILNMIKNIEKTAHLRFQGIMAYEAHVAGVGDQNPFKPLLSLLLKPMRSFCSKSIAKKRKEILQNISRQLPKDFIFNGGGTGSLSFNRSEANVLTELTAGSGFYCPHLFDYYSNFHLEPAAFFALQIARQAEKNWYTCLGGGYVASGEPGWDRLPQLFSPKEKMELSGFEGAGEVQTPVQTQNKKSIGDNIVFRHAKAGELMERFNEVLLIEKDNIHSRAKTYRGHGECYF
jgi:D-serine deaminase-like pyridoxal phosphate-dependent protein